MLTSKIIITEIIENYSMNFLGDWKAAMTMFQAGLDNLQNYLWYCCEQHWCWSWECRGCKRIPKRFDLLKIWATSLKIRIKMALNVAWLHKMAPEVCKKTHEDLFWRSHQKGVDDLCGREFACKSCTKNFCGKFGEIRAKILRNP